MSHFPCYFSHHSHPMQATRQLKGGRGCGGGGAFGDSSNVSSPATYTCMFGKAFECMYICLCVYMHASNVHVVPFTSTPFANAPCFCQLVCRSDEVEAIPDNSIKLRYTLRAHTHIGYRWRRTPTPLPPTGRVAFDKKRLRVCE